MYPFNASTPPSKWPATEVHSFVASGFFAWHNHCSGPCYVPLKLTPSSNINLIGVISSFVSYWLPPATMDAVLATIVAGRQARIQLN
jgi:hypothetical protein